MSENSIWDTVASLGGISTLAAASRTILSEDRRSITGFLRGLVLAIFVGVLTGFAMNDYDFGPGTQGAIVGVSAFVADDILMIILAVTKNLRKDPSKLIDFILRR